MTRQPNILLIQVDQLAASFLPAYGNSVAKTPHLDSLAERSVVFDAAYTNFALCAPSRFSMLSGRLASEIDTGSVTTLDETGLAEDTVIVFTTDHGDMMGERGLWYKRTFFEGASRIPLMVSWPKRFTQKRISDNVSLVDLLPTFCDLAGDRGLIDAGDSLDGRSLVPLLNDGVDTSLDDTVYCESLAEGATAPIVMVKRGALKFISSGCVPEQLFDLESDPLEMSNIVEAPEYSSAVDELRAATGARWDIEALHDRVAASQRRRSFLRSVATASGTPDWGHVPPDQAGQRVLRDDETYNDWAYGFSLKSKSER